MRPYPTYFSPYYGRDRSTHSGSVSEECLCAHKNSVCYDEARDVHSNRLLNYNKRPKTNFNQLVCARQNVETPIARITARALALINVYLDPDKLDYKKEHEKRA